jgi:hypothetical protein
MINQKDMTKLHNLPKFSKVIKNKKGILRDFKSGGGINMYWGWNKEASLDQIFALSKEVNGETVTFYIDWQELTHYGRAVSDWKNAFQAALDAEEQAKRGF